MPRQATKGKLPTTRFKCGAQLSRQLDWRRPCSKTNRETHLRSMLLMHTEHTDQVCRSVTKTQVLGRAADLGACEESTCMGFKTLSAYSKQLKRTKWHYEYLPFALSLWSLSYERANRAIAGRRVLRWQGKAACRPGSFMAAKPVGAQGDNNWWPTLSPLSWARCSMVETRMADDSLHVRSRLACRSRKRANAWQATTNMTTTK